MVLEMCILKILDIAISLVGLKISNMVKVNMGFSLWKGWEEVGRVGEGYFNCMSDLMLGMFRDFAFGMMFEF